MRHLHRVGLASDGNQEDGPLLNLAEETEEVPKLTSTVHLLCQADDCYHCIKATKSEALLPLGRSWCDTSYAMWRTHAAIDAESRQRHSAQARRRVVLRSLKSVRKKQGLIMHMCVSMSVEERPDRTCKIRSSAGPAWPDSRAASMVPLSLSHLRTMQAIRR